VRDYVPVMITQAIYAHNVSRPSDTGSAQLPRRRVRKRGLMRANKAATLPIATRRMDVSPEAASRIYDELIDNYSTMAGSNQKA